MYALHKYSSPGWTKKFDTLEELTAAVRLETCMLCAASYGTDLDSMLASDCGCEYGADGLTSDGFNMAEYLQRVVGDVSQ